jgi:dolichol kinase
VELGRVRSARVRGVFTSTVGGMLRQHEYARLSGATWLAISYTIAVLMFAKPVAIAAMLSAAFGDASAAIIGKSFGRHRPRWMQDKSLEGSAACALAAGAGALFIAGVGPAASVITGVTAAIAEAPGRPFDDNIRIVTAVGICVTGWLWCCGV